MSIIEQVQSSKKQQLGSVDVVLGGQLGDEGKGRLIDILSSSGDYGVVARCNSGGNAGHKVVIRDKTYAFHMVPSGILSPNVLGVIGNGCVINLDDLRKELDTISSTLGESIHHRLVISDRAHIVLPLHKEADGVREDMKASDYKSSTSLQTPATPASNRSIGTTKQGMGPVYATKALRVGLRMCDLFLSELELRSKIELLLDELYLLPLTKVSSADILEYLEGHKKFYLPMIQDTATLLNTILSKEITNSQPFTIPRSTILSTTSPTYLSIPSSTPLSTLINSNRVLVEGAQAALLDVDFGVYPYCTATSTTIGSVSQGLGIPPYYISEIGYVIKTYCTRVGNGPFPTELVVPDPVGVHLQEVGCEYGTTTGRRRRCGWLDIPMVKWGMMLNGVLNGYVCITKLDVLDELKEIKVGVGYYIETHNQENPNQENSNQDTTNQETPDNTITSLEGFPASLELLGKVKVRYETYPGWCVSTKGVREYGDLPVNARKYLERIEELLGVKIRYIGVGPDRVDMINRVLNYLENQIENNLDVSNRLC
jgi:adenylosuccinate synthase